MRTCTLAPVYMRFLSEWTQRSHDGNRAVYSEYNREDTIYSDAKPCLAHALASRWDGSKANCVVCRLLRKLSRHVTTTVTTAELDFVSTTDIITTYAGIKRNSPNIEKSIFKSFVDIKHKYVGCGHDVNMHAYKAMWVWSVRQGESPEIHCS